jgi:CTP:molybdopterin cytidylyltransferase MocA
VPLSKAAVVSVVLGAHSASVARVIEGLPVHRLTNREFREGVASSIRTAAAWARRLGLNALILAAVAQPFVEPGHLARLISKFNTRRQRVASEYSAVRGIPALFPSHDFERLEAPSGDSGARLLLRGDPELDTVSFPQGALDVDCTRDLETALESYVKVRFRGR